MEKDYSIFLGVTLIYSKFKNVTQQKASMELQFSYDDTKYE